MLDPVRTVPLFSEYLDASGIFPYSNYTGAGQYKGAWATSTAYVQGDIVYVAYGVPGYSNVTGYSGVYNGRLSFWICKIGHTSGSTNQPITGYDASNPFAGPTQVWEEAFISMWLKPQILLGTQYGGSTCTTANACNDGSLLPIAANSVANSGGGIYAVGLLNQWIRSGYRVTHPRLMGGYAAAPGCSPDNGTTWTACGASPLKPIQYIPPPMVAN